MPNENDAAANPAKLYRPAGRDPRTDPRPGVAERAAQESLTRPHQLLGFDTADLDGQ